MATLERLFTFVKNEAAELSFIFSPTIAFKLGVSNDSNMADAFSSNFCCLCGSGFVKTNLDNGSKTSLTSPVIVESGRRSQVLKYSPFENNSIKFHICHDYHQVYISCNFLVFLVLGRMIVI